jgi:hypothetical protein
MATSYPSASLCVSAAILAALGPSLAAALDAYAARALDDPDARPGTPQEAAAWDQLERLLGGPGRWAGASPRPRPRQPRG